MPAAQISRLFVGHEEVFFAGWANPQVERQEQRLGEGKEGKRHHEHEHDGGDLKELPRAARPGPEQETNHPNREDGLHRHQVEEVGPQPVTLFPPLEPRPHTGQFGTSRDQVTKTGPTAAMRAAQAQGANEVPGSDASDAGSVTLAHRNLGWAIESTARRPSGPSQAAVREEAVVGARVFATAPGRSDDLAKETAAPFRAAPSGRRSRAG